MPGQILIPKFGRRGQDAARANRAFRDVGMFKKYVDAEKHRYRRRAQDVFSRYKNYQHNKKAELWQEVDPHFWDDDANVKKFLKDNRETQPWRS